MSNTGSSYCGATGIVAPPADNEIPASTGTAPTSGLPGLAELESRLSITRGQSVAVLRAPVESRLRLLAAGQPNPYRADVIIGFATRKPDLAWLKPVYAAARADRRAWIFYPRAGRPGTDLRQDWLLGKLHQYGVGAAEEVSIDLAWSALRLCRSDDHHSDNPGDHAVRLHRA